MIVMRRPRQKHLRSLARGTATVEAVLVIPLMFLIILGICELGWSAHCAQLLHNAARQGARIAMYHENSNAEVEQAVESALHSSLDLDPNEINVRISKLNSQGNEAYQVTSLGDNENKDNLRVLVTVNNNRLGFATNMLRLRGGTLTSYAVVRRLK